MKISFDCDDVLADTNGKYEKELQNVRITQRIHPIWQQWEQDLGSEISHKLYGLFRTNTFVQNLRPLTGSIEAIKRLSEMDVELVVVTSRAADRRQDTWEWINKYYGEGTFSNIFFTHDEKWQKVKTKGEFCAEHNVHFHVEDNPREIPTLQSQNVKTLLLSQFWNENVKDGPLVQRMQNWDTVVEYVKNLLMEKTL